MKAKELIESDKPANGVIAELLDLVRSDIRVAGWYVWAGRDRVEAENQNGYGLAWVEAVPRSNEFFINTDRNTNLPDRVHDAMVRLQKQIFGGDLT